MENVFQVAWIIIFIWNSDKLCKW